MGIIEIFFEEHFKTVQTIRIGNDIYFNANAIAMALEYKNPQRAIREHCKKVRESVLSTSQGYQKVKFICESDIYRLILGTKSKMADNFKTWICESILPDVLRIAQYTEYDRPDAEMRRDWEYLWGRY